MPQIQKSVISGVNLSKSTTTSLPDGENHQNKTDANILDFFLDDETGMNNNNINPPSISDETRPLMMEEGSMMMQYTKNSYPCSLKPQIYGI